MLIVWNFRSSTKLKKIGEGLYGKVFVVESKETGDLYAAKVSKRRIFKRDEKNTNIYREARFISQLNHPCILRFIGYSPLDFDDNKKPVILTEYNSNGSLQSLLDLERRGVEIDEFDNTKKLMIIYGIASCMSFLHRKGMIHRDLTFCLINIYSLNLPTFATPKTRIKKIF